MITRKYTNKRVMASIAKLELEKTLIYLGFIKVDKPNLALKVFAATKLLGKDNYSDFFVTVKFNCLYEIVIQENEDIELINISLDDVISLKEKNRLYAYNND